MKIAMCIKQVPDTAEIEIDPKTNTIIRSGVESIINPYDLYAIEEGVKIGEKLGCKNYTICMGPPQALIAVQESIARGAQKGYLVCDKKFSGSDTYATSYILSKALKKTGLPDLIICGKQAVDGDTAQVGPELAVHLGYDFYPNVSSVLSIDDKKIKFKTVRDNHYYTVESKLPVIISVIKGINIPRLPSFSEWIKAKKSRINILDSRSFSFDQNLTGLKNSPTRVKKISGVSFRKNTIFFDGNPGQQALSILKIIRKNTGREEKSVKRNINLDYQKFSDKKIAVIGETENGKIHSSTYELFSKSVELGKKLKAGTILFLNSEMNNILKSNKKLPAREIYLFEHSALTGFNPSLQARLFTYFLKEINPDIILGAATAWGRAVLPMIAAQLGAGITADCTRFEIDKKNGQFIQIRPAYGGNIEASIINQKFPNMATVRPQVFSDNTDDMKYSYETIIYKPQIPVSLFNNSYISSFSEKVKIKEADILNAELIISGGYGLGGKDGFKLLYQLADLLNGAVGASRSAADAGWIDNTHQIGQTGRTVQPALYLACAISGAVQHLVGMKSSDTIVAINKDKNAPIFKVADFGIIGDYRPVLEELKNELDRLQK